MSNEIKIKPKTPKKLSSLIKEFLKSVGITDKPIFLSYEKRDDEYIVRECLTTCEVESSRTGSKIIYGWIVWQDKKNSFIEAVFHSVILENSRLIDITPREDNERVIMFVKDRNKVAKRFDPQTWDTWSSFKSFNGIIIEVSKSELRRKI